MNKFVCYILGAIFLVIGTTLYAFAAVSGELFVKTVARLIIKSMVMPSFEQMIVQAENCAAYEDGIVDDKEFKNSKRRIGTDSFKECTAGGKTHYYLYHVTNAADVMKGTAEPVVEKRGPWVFTTETRSYTMTHHEDRNTVERTERSFKLIDDDATKKLCPKCATDRLCASWPDEDTKKKTPTHLKEI